MTLEALLRNVYVSVSTHTEIATLACIVMQPHAHAKALPTPFVRHAVLHGAGMMVQR